MADIRGAGSGQPANQQSSVETLALQSSFMQQASYDKSSFQLTIHLKSGHQIVYWYVFPQTWEAFKQHPSKGSFYSTAIKGQHQSHTLKRPMMVSDLKKAKEGQSSWFREGARKLQSPSKFQ